MLLEIKKLNKIYHSGKVDFQALNNVNVNFEKGEFSANSFKLTAHTENLNLRYSILLIFPGVVVTLGIVKK